MNDMNGYPLSDSKERVRIASDLETSMLVEAAAGTGKTTSMVQRMTALLAEGACTAGELAAVTFTRKAAAEMRARFRVELEEKVRTLSGKKRERCVTALDTISRCFIGTIHSFCGRLLRERPVEAGVELDFGQIEEDEELRLQQEAWETCCARLYAENDPLLSELGSLGLGLNDLRDIFSEYILYPDVDIWPAEPVHPLPDLDEIRKKACAYRDHIRSLPRAGKAGTDDILNLFENIHWYIRCTDWHNYRSAERFLGNFRENPAVRKTLWPDSGTREQEIERWNRFREEVCVPFVQALHEHRYSVLMKVLEKAGHEYERKRKRAGGLDFTGLLIRSAELLRKGGSHVRSYFHKRFTHICVDEFQDTDPVQAEVMMLLAADDPEEADWRKVCPRPGALFVVGDPKQSIYRFRRADLITYNTVRSLIEKNGGAVVTLSVNFRSVSPVITWVNSVFENEFPQERNPYSPEYVRLEPGPDTEEHGDGPCILRLDVPSEYTNQETIAEYDAGVIARHIKNAIETGMQIRTPSANGGTRSVQPEDFLILTRTRYRLNTYADALEELGVPSQVTGGTVLNEVPELECLHLCLSAVIHPSNPVFLAGVLRSSLFGISDTDLYRFIKAGGEFDFRKPVPGTVPEDTAEKIEAVFSRLRTYSRWLDVLPPVSAVHKTAQDLGLHALAMAARGGNVRAGSFGKVFELLRRVQQDTWSVSAVVERLGELAGSLEQYDGIPASPWPGGPVRIMNVHKAKGLQAPIVFLADPSGRYTGGPVCHIERSGTDITGRMAASKRSGWHDIRIASPPDWEEWSDIEQQFQDAEETRLRYVAATRAGVKLIVSLRGKSPAKNPWYPFASRLASCPSLEDPGIQKPAQETFEPVTLQEFRSAEESIGERKNIAVSSTYTVRSAKKDAVTENKRFTGKEFGMAWGTVIHTLLEAYMRKPDADLSLLAESAARDQGFSPMEASQALGTVRSVTGSDVWKRAAGSLQCLTEVPFRLCCEENSVRTVTRGVIDLVFREGKGWVIVDYKTDDTLKNDINDLADHYRPQLKAYEQAWLECTGEPVKEKGLFFTETNEYIKIQD